MKGGFFMKLLKKIIPFVVVLATVFSVFVVQNTFAKREVFGTNHDKTGCG